MLGIPKAPFTLEHGFIFNGTCLKCGFVKKDVKKKCIHFNFIQICHLTNDITTFVVLTSPEGVGGLHKSSLKILNGGNANQNLGINIKIIFSLRGQNAKHMKGKL